ncbi:RNA polymerase sporulation specific sigma factor SigH [Euzebya pacifica]|uniref:RNA polymerase sporulation specific sigma factor SigH n=2 Tax=Euzebya pacifica TaxID=1608957 RepID=A0A346Y0C0_9ACTN|nr:RNA polymerase sporulation sigma factor SigH [Euzebya pacifica]AXV07917.1 RNA polymerase sporulation specific sigma factor SigH [Euzebya pacifica]
MTTATLAPDSTELADEDLVEVARTGDEAALAELLRRFRPQVRAKAKTYFLSGGDRQDVIQEGMIGLYKAVRDYDRSKHPSFRHFADLCVTRQVITAIKGANRRKHAPLNAYVSLTGSVSHEDDSDMEYRERIADDGQDPIHKITSATDLDQLRSFCAEVLSDLETEVLVRYVSGESYSDIAVELGRHAKAIDNALQRVKRKLEQYVEERRIRPTD